MRTSTLLRYLIGNREAILTIAGNRHALWIGFLFVLSAGFARDYDDEDLLHEPWHLVIPLGASLASSLALFSLAYGVAAGKGAPWKAFFTNYASFLGLFWMTAPLAWLYAIPYERFLSPVDAMRMNLLSLGIVAAWRVALMVRVVMVILNYSLPAALSLVLLFADGIALALLRFLPFPLINVMGGLRLSESEHLLRNVAQTVFMVGGCTLPIWLLAGVAFLVRSRPTWQVAGTASSGSFGLGWLAIASLLVWAAILPRTQPEQIRKRRVDKAVAEKRFEEALEEMSRWNRSDYPPGWEPPPKRFDGHAQNDDLLAVLTIIARTEPARWVSDLYLDKVAELFEPQWWDMGSDACWRFAQELKHRPEGPVVLAMLEARGHTKLANVVKKAMKEMK